MIYNIVNDENNRSVSVFVDGKLHVAHGDHPQFEAILAGVIAGDESVVDLFSLETTIIRKVVDQRLSDRIAIRNGEVLFDGDALHGALTDVIIDHVTDNDVTSLLPLVAFLEKVQANQSETVRNGLYDWIQQQELSIAPDGSFYGYKGVDDNLRSIHKGPGIVNDVEQTGALDNSPGNVLEVARSYVDDNASNYCSTGLHVGTKQYAKSWGSRVVLVKVDPRNVVQIPTDGHYKLRTSKYEVIEELRVEAYPKVYDNITANIQVRDNTVPISDIVANAITANVIQSGSITAGVLRAGQVGRDSKGRFVKGGGTLKRDAQGRFTKF